MNRLHLLAVAGLASVAGAQQITPGTTPDLLAEANALFADTNLVTVNSATLTANAVTVQCGGVAEQIQFGVARGFLGANGFVISNAWVENQDEENPPTAMTADPTLCASNEGAMGTFPGIGFCDAADPLLVATLTSPGGVPVTTEDAAIFAIDFDCAVDTTVDLSYSLATFELPTDAAFYDSFGIFLDNNLIAGGTTNGVPPAGTDPWSLSSSPSTPAFEYNSLPVNGFFVTPANTTGLRTISLALTAGNHVLEFHVADGGNGIADTTCNSSTDNVVDTSLFVGLHTFRSGNAGAHTPGLEIGRVGHPTVTGGPFGDDLQIQLTGAPAGSILVLAQSPTSMPGFTIPLLAPNEIVVGLAPFQLLTTQTATGTGTDVFPPVPPSIPAGVAGSRFHYQWWAIVPAVGFQNSQGMAVTF